MISIFDQETFAPFPAPFNMAQYVLDHAGTTPDRVALSVIHEAGSEDWTYKDLQDAVLGTAAGLLSCGLQPGDRVLLRLGNSVDFPILYLAAISAGLIPVPTSAQLTSAEISQMAAIVRPALIVAQDDVALPGGGDVPVVYAKTYSAWLGLPPATYQLGDPERPAYIIFTSGTGGTPKAVVHAHRAVWARRMMWNDWYALSADDRLFHAGAFNWTYTLGTGLMDPWAIGATALVASTPIAPAQIAATLAQHRVTLFAAAPGVFRQILQHPFPAVATLRHGLSAGEKMPSATQDAWQKATGTKVFEAFGMSECSTFISTSPNHTGRNAHIGRPQSGRRVAIMGSEGPVACDQPGTIAIAKTDPGLMLGYWQDAQGTAERFQGEWFLTGDIGSMSEAGDITYLGRHGDMMNAGGFRVSPIEVETAMRTCKGVQDCAAIEVAVKPDVTIIALFYLADNAIEATIMEGHASGVLARYKQPREYIRVASLPRGANNKLLRRKLRDDYQAGQGSCA